MKTNYFFKHLFGSLIFFSLIFISAGKINYWQGLLYLGIGMIMLILNYTIFKIDADLAKERATPGEGTLEWDKKILLLSLLVSLSMNTLAGLDSGRYHWSPKFHILFTLIGIVFTITGQVLFLTAQKQNKFFSSTVRIQTNRDHIVYDKGLYSFVRHPAYLGTIIQAIGFPLIFGSLWSMIPAFLSIVIFITRTYLEDKTLKEKLTNYKEYCLKTKYKLIPFVW